MKDPREEKQKWQAPIGCANGIMGGESSEDAVQRARGVPHEPDEFALERMRLAQMKRYRRAERLTREFSRRKEGL